MIEVDPPPEPNARHASLLSLALFCGVRMVLERKLSAAGLERGAIYVVACLRRSRTSRAAKNSPAL